MPKLFSWEPWIWDDLQWRCKAWCSYLISWLPLTPDDANALTMAHMTGHVSQYTWLELIMKSLNQSPASARSLAWWQLGGQGIGCSQLPAVAAAVRGEPEFKFSFGRSCTVVQCVHMYSARTRPGLSGTVQGEGAGTGAGSDQSGYSERGEHTASVTVSVTTVLLQSERESCPGQCTPTCTRT